MERSSPPPSPEELAIRLDAVDTRLQQVVLRVEALFELLLASGHVGQAELEAKLREIDLRDGVEDGRNVAPVVQVCGKCSHRQLGQQRFCARCGSDALQAA
ncbi:hypothetical protein [Synechococcus sp. CBW1108]|uniref:hypothetical protein n=1 Tax=Synechococcus sp. CBW1108 TaxID=1353147 RepID=UPI0018CDC55E|nr:hypothetical protein [Synechococcus sp. CBW1108]QPN71256.1 hypothetical protein H8F27_06655 [Synechococcus sp. CBW1108]